ncbi:APC family permease [Enterococcus sp. LJL99]
MEKTQGASSSSSSIKKLSFFSIFLLGINGIIGSGTFLLPQQIYQDAGVFWGVICILAAGISTTLIALCYADLSGRFSESGGAWLYSYHAYGKFVGFEVGFFMWFAGVVSISAEIAALIRVFKNLVPSLNNQWVSLVVGIALIFILGAINWFGVNMVKLVSNVSSTLKLLTIIGFIIVGAFFLKSVNFAPMVPEKMASSAGLFKNISSTYSVVFYMFTGFSFLPIAARQMNNPQKNLPKALVTIMLSIIVIYSAVQIVAIGVLGPELAKTTIPVALAMKKMLGDWGYYLIIAGSTVSTFGLAFTSSFDVPIIASSLANEHKLLPAFFGKTNKHGAPYFSIILTVIISSFLLSTGSYVFLATCMVCANFVQYVPTILATIKFKKNNQYPTQGFHLKGGILVPVLALIGSLYLLVGFNFKVILVAISVFVIGLIIYLIENHSDKKTQQSQSSKN